MAQEPIARLESLIERLLAERSELMQCNEVLRDERDRLRSDRTRVQAELDKILKKLDQLEGSTA